MVHPTKRTYCPHSPLPHSHHLAQDILELAMSTPASAQSTEVCNTGVHHCTQLLSPLSVSNMLKHEDNVHFPSV